MQIFTRNGKLLVHMVKVVLFSKLIYVGISRLTYFCDRERFGLAFFVLITDNGNIGLISKILGNEPQMFCLDNFYVPYTYVFLYDLMCLFVCYYSVIVSAYKKKTKFLQI